MPRGIGKIDTTTTILFVGAAAAVIYFMTKKTTPTAPTTVYIPTVPAGGGSGISTAQYVQLGTALTDAISNIFG